MSCCVQGWLRLILLGVVPQAALHTLIGKVALRPRGPGPLHLVPCLCLLVGSLGQCAESSALERVGAACSLLQRSSSLSEGFLWCQVLPGLLTKLFAPTAALNKAFNLFLTSGSLVPAGALLYRVIAGTELTPDLVEELVVPSLPGLARRRPVALAAWGLTLLFTGAAKDPLLRSAGLCLLPEPRQLDELLVVSAGHFCRARLPDDRHGEAFFQAVADSGLQNLFASVQNQS